MAPPPRTGTVSIRSGPFHGDRRARTLGAIAGLVPAVAIAAVFVIGRTPATAPEIAGSMVLVGLISVAAGWIAGPLAAGTPRRLVVASFGYALAYIGATIALSVVQAAWDATTADGSVPLGIAGAVAGRALYGLAGIAYLPIPAIALGFAWAVAVRGLTHFDGWKA